MTSVGDYFFIVTAYFDYNSEPHLLSEHWCVTNKEEHDFGDGLKEFLRISLQVEPNEEIEMLIPHNYVGEEVYFDFDYEFDDDDIICGCRVFSKNEKEGKQKLLNYIEEECIRDINRNTMLLEWAKNQKKTS